MIGASSVKPASFASVHHQAHTHSAIHRLDSWSTIEPYRHVADRSWAGYVNPACIAHNRVLCATHGSLERSEYAVWYFRYARHPSLYVQVVYQATIGRDRYVMRSEV